MMLNELFSKILEAIFPPKCFFCGEFGVRECESCRRSLSKSFSLKERTINERVVCVSPFVYCDLIGIAIRKFKFQNARRGANLLAFWLAKAVDAQGFDCVTSVPMFPKRRGEKGYNQAEILAIKLAAELKLPYVETLKKIKNNRTQRGLNAKERKENIDGVFEALPLVKGKKIILVDDVITTGSTLVECVKMLESCGAEKILCAALSHVKFNY
jgi:ComF family protein